MTGGLWALLMLAPVMLLQSSCSTTPEPHVETTASYGPGYPAGSAGWTDKERALYRAAFDAGRRDQREGYRFDDDRVTIPLDVDSRSYSRQGYRAGYYYDASRRRAARAAAASSVQPSEDNPFSSSSLSPASSHSDPYPPAPATPAPKPAVKRQGGDPFAIPLEGDPAGETPGQ